MRVDVAFTPGEAVSAPVAIVVDVPRATSTITQALASGFRRVYCCAEIVDARSLREELGERLLGGERTAARIEDFDVGASPREFLREPRAEAVIFSTTNGTCAILAAAGRCGEVLLGSLLNLEAVAAAARERGRTSPCCAPAFRARSRTRTRLCWRTYGPPGLEEDIAFCAQESVLDVVPRFVNIRGRAAEIARA